MSKRSEYGTMGNVGSYGHLEPYHFKAEIEKCCKFSIDKADCDDFAWNKNWM